MNRFPTSCLPSPEQSLLLQAALLDGPQAVEAWRAWRRRVNAVREYLDLGSFHLLPLVYHNLKGLGFRDDFTGRLAGIHRKTWVGNQRILQMPAEVLQILETEGIPALLVGDAALVLRHYPDLGARPVTAPSVVIPAEHARRGETSLLANGWMPRGGTGDAGMAKFPGLPRFWLKTGVQGPPVEVKTTVLAGGDEAGVDASVRAEAVPVRLPQGVEALLPRPEHGLSILLADGIWPRRPGSPLWVADACVLLRSVGSEMDWDRLMETASRCALTLVTARGLDYVRLRFNAPVPSTVVDGLESPTAGYAERREWCLRCKTPAPLTPLARDYAEYLRRTMPADPRAEVVGIAGFPSWWMGRHGLRSCGELARRAVSRFAAFQQPGPESRLDEAEQRRLSRFRS